MTIQTQTNSSIKKALKFILLIYISFIAIPASANGTKCITDLCSRIVPGLEKSIAFKITKSEPNKDWYRIYSDGNKICIEGNTTNSLAVGLNHYLNKYCHVHISWNLSDTVTVPTVLPRVNQPVQVTAKCKERFCLNYCTFGYSMPYWGWNEWERLIDWMALNGVTTPLAITGQESIWYEVWKGFGLTDSQINSYFTGPAHLPWNRMSNVDGWDGPLPSSWLQKQESLQENILEREREFSMKPILPAFAGHVPQGLKELFPKAKVSQMESWGGFDDKYRSYFLDPEDSLYSIIQKRFIEAQIKRFGTSHIYGIDPFNEVAPPQWGEEYLSNVSKKIYKSLSDVDPQAKWLQMTWTFYNSPELWTTPRIKSFLEAVPNNNLHLLDYYCDHTEIWRQTNKYFNKPFYWCYLGNFGGNSMIVGNLKDVDHKIDVTIDSCANLEGLGVTLEGIDVNPVMYEYVFSKAWDTNEQLPQWIDNWSACRGGNVDDNVTKAWKLLSDSIYIDKVDGSMSTLMNARPTLKGVDGWCNNTKVAYDTKVLLKVWKMLVEAKNVDNKEYRFDVVNVGRQVLGNIFTKARDKFTQNYEANNLNGAKYWAKMMDKLLCDRNRLLLCEPNLSLGKWISEARNYGTNKTESDYYETNAKRLVSTWGQKATQLNDYANRDWSGLTLTFYRERWKRFTDNVINCLIENKKFDKETFIKNITDFEEDWVNGHESYVISSHDNPVTISKELLIQDYISIL